MKISRHPAAESLMSCAAGSMPEAFAAVMASHIEICSECRKDLTLMTVIGTTMLDMLPGTPVARASAAMALRGMEADHDGPPVARGGGDMPAALVTKLGHSLDSIPWKRVSFGIRQHQIPLSHEGRGSLRLVKVAPGQKMAEHSHNGSELSLVLRGSYYDATGDYGPGDLADVSEEVEHAPVAGSLGCICLIANDGRMRFKGRVARLLQPFNGF